MATEDSPETDVRAEVRRVREMNDAGRRGRRATELIEQFDAARIELTSIRKEALDELIRAGISQNDIATKFGLTKGRISQIKKAGAPVERAFLGASGLTVALPLKLDAEYKRYALAFEDVEVWDRLKQLAEDNQLKASRELISPPGDINLNRQDLLVVCGPKLSPSIASVLETDSAIRFEQAKDGRFLLHDLVTDQRYDSPGDVSDRRADVAYLARLNRPDGKGTLLVLTGIHAVGSLGVVRYLEQNLSDVYEQVGTGRFSCILEAEYDEGRRVTASRLITPLYTPEGH